MSSLLREISGLGSRPYPLDRERRRRVLVALAERDMTISGLARALNLPQSLVSMTIGGRRLSTKAEQRIADFLGKPADYLFPFRAPKEIGRMRQAEAAEKGRGQKYVC
jgi:plasmid maintenance system antidote protein VapI